MDIVRELGITDGIHAVDLSAAVLKERDPRDICAVGDMENLPYPDGMFDRVLFIAALHHVGDTRKALAEAYRVLKPGGHVVLNEPTSIRLRLLRQGIRPTPDGVEFAFSLPYLLRHLKEGGFAVTQLWHQGFLYRFLPKSDVRFLRIVERIEETVDRVPLLRNLAGYFSNTVVIIARKPS